MTVPSFRRLSYLITCLSCFLFFFLVTVVLAQPASKVLVQKFSDGVERWYLPESKDGKSFLAKKFEEISGILLNDKKSRPFGRSVGFIVGVSKYKYISPQLPSVENDINSMRDFLLQKAGFDEVYIAQNDIVNRQLIGKYFTEIIGNHMQENDRLLFYYSGHGGDKGGITGYMQFGKAKNNIFYDENVLEINTLKNWSHEIRVKHILYLLDCCSSGLGLVPKSSSSSSDESRQLLLKTLSGNGSRIVLTAGTGDEKTYAYDYRADKNYGIFTKAFLNAFESLSLSTKETGLITITDLYAGIQKEVGIFGGQHEKSVTPRMWELDPMEYKGTFVFINPVTKKAKLTNEQKEMFGVSTVTKGEGDSGEGIIEVSSKSRGKVSIDGQDMGWILKGQVRQFVEQPVGKHQILFKGFKDETKDVFVANGKIARASFGLVSPIDKSGKLPVGKLVVISMDHMGGDVYLDGYNVGILEKDSMLSIENLIEGTYDYRVDDPKLGSTIGDVRILAGKTAFIEPPRPSAPTNFRIQ